MGTGGRDFFFFYDGDIENDSREERRKLAVAITAFMSGLAVIARGHNRASSMDEKLPVLRGMMVLLSRSYPRLWRKRSSVVCSRLVFFLP